MVIGVALRFVGNVLVLGTSQSLNALSHLVSTPSSTKKSRHQQVTSRLSTSRLTVWIGTSLAASKWSIQPTISSSLSDLLVRISLIQRRYCSAWLHPSSRNCIDSRMAALFGTVVARCVSSIHCIVTALADLRCFPCPASGFPARSAFVCCGSGRSICFVHFGCYGCHCCFCRFRFGRDFFCSRSSTGSASRVSVGGHWCNDFCLPVLGPTRGNCRHRTRVSRGLIWLKSLYNGRNHFVVAGHHLSWHRSRSRPSPTASSYSKI